MLLIYNLICAIKTVGILRNKTVTANFVQITYTFTIAVSGNGTTTPGAGTYSHPAGTVVRVTAAPSAGWVFSNWSGDATGSANPIDITMNTNKTITANFVPVGMTVIGNIKQNPQLYNGVPVQISGVYRGWQGGHGSPPVFRSDWVLQDASGSIYVTGGSKGLRYPQDAGKPVTVNGIVRLKSGIPYIDIRP